MPLSFKSYRLENKRHFLESALHWAHQFSHVAYYNHHDIGYPNGPFQEVLAVGCKTELKADNTDSFAALREFHQGKWLFGYLGYDLKNELEELRSTNQDALGFEDMAFFEAEHLFFFEADSVRIASPITDLFESICSREVSPSNSSFGSPMASVSKQNYLETVKQLQWHIEEGDCYEINYCQEFHGRIDHADPIQTFLKLSEISPKPFACFQKWRNQYILCASPERYLQKSGNRLISQPIKGTRPRGLTAAEDTQLCHELRHDEKELAENMMIVDLVRNDLARVSEIGSVGVKELFGIYSFRQAHQMISTVGSILRPAFDFVDALECTFPMGSMTGAPKIRVMQLIEQYENTKRGPFSGAAGYINPDGDFDFNVLIRSLFLNTSTNTYSFQVGSAITYDAIPEKEYEECLLKAKAIFEVLADSTNDR